MLGETAVAAWAWAELQNGAVKAATSAVNTGVTKGTDLVKKRLNEVWRKVEWSRAEEKYRIALLEIVRCTKVLGNPKSIEIDRIYTDVYVFDKLSAIRRYSEAIDEDTWESEIVLEERERLGAREVIGGERNTFILGRPGAGKTTFLKYLAILACRGLSVETPIFVSLKDWSDSTRPLKDYIVTQFDICGFPDASVFVEALLQQGGALVLLDGLDEVNEWGDKRNQVIRDVVNFTNKYSKNKYCLTCRTAATDYSFERFKYVEVADFSLEQQERFAAQWYGKKSTMLEKFLTAWRDPRHAGFRDLGKTPLLLTLLCLTFDETLTFPKRHVDVYQEAINALLKKWDTSRLIARDDFYRELSFGQRLQLLETIAAEFYFESKSVFKRPSVVTAIEMFVKSLPSHEDGASVDGNDVVRQIEAQHGLLVERAKDVYSFSHLTVQEYFTASYIVKNQNVNLQRQIVTSALNDQKWREVMIHTVALLPKADSLLDEMQRQLLNMRGASSGVLVFLGKCFSDAKLQEVGNKPIPGSEHYYYFGLNTAIEGYIGGLSQPSLTRAELAKFGEHIQVLHEFLKLRADRRAYSLASRVVASAIKFLQNDALDAARLLGGYFIKPEQFINFFYSTRLMMECLEVAITSRRDEYLGSILTLNQRDIGRIEETIRKPS